MFGFHISLVSLNLDQFLRLHVFLRIFTLLMKSAVSLFCRLALHYGLFPSDQIPIIDGVSRWVQYIRRQMMSIYPVTDGGNFDLLVMEGSAFSPVKLLFFLLS